ncbi:MAG: SWIM zinc finger family protein [Theionarchaea archaeon]|nr:SWIM zinc finger family protein [Theionarchaea archaeon]
MEVCITGDITSTCTCPVGIMCKHGVALLLQWIHDRESIIDIDQLMVWLEKRDKEELIDIIHSMIKDAPRLALDVVSFQKVKEDRIDIDEISKRLCIPDLEYFSPSIIDSFERVEEIACMLVKEQHFKKAAQVYLLLVEKGIDVLYTIDDSDGFFFDSCLEYVGAFASITKEMDKVENDVVHKIIDIIVAEDYGVGTEEMLYSVATRENVSFIEEDIFNRITEEGFDEYIRGKLLDILADVYNKLGMYKDSIRITKKAGLKDSNDYLRIALALTGQNDYEKALSYVREGLAKGENTQLGELYFTIVASLPEEIDVNEKEAMTIALQVLSSYSYNFDFSPERYSTMKSVFANIGKHEEFISNIKKKCKSEVVLAVLLREDRIEEAIECALSSYLSFLLVIHVAEIAKEEGYQKAARQLILKALKQGVYPFYDSVKELITFFVMECDDNELKEGIDNIPDTPVAKMFVEALLERNQKCAVQMMKKIIDSISKEELIQYTKKLKKEYAKEMCQLWASIFVDRSHVYYGDVIDILEILREISSEKEWTEYVLDFLEENRGKKKFVKQFKMHFGDFPMRFPDRDY